ncbi:MAG: ROK family protein, partial [Alphaproteobacteria bacterium]|nr:ROK family protein [Alphaproteobacteria bacterium]
MRIGVDLGSTKTEIVALGDDGATLDRARVASPQGDYAATIVTIASLVAACEARTGRHGTVGVGIPGVVDPDSGTVRGANSTWLNGMPLGRDLAAALGREVRLANDANCFAISEVADGAGAGARCVFGVIVGTGCGAGIVVDGRLLTGRHAIAGEWGYNPLLAPLPGELPGPACWCAKRGCVETWLSGPALARDFHAATGRTETTDRIALLAATGDGDTEAALARYEDRMARALAVVVNLLDPEIIVLGGGLSRIERLYRNVPALVAPRLFTFAAAVDIALVPPR